MFLTAFKQAASDAAAYFIVVRGSLCPRQRLDDPRRDTDTKDVFSMSRIWTVLARRPSNIEDLHGIDLVVCAV